jgi:predicted RNA-binding protein YlqC (UPF0109 family)
MNTATTEPLVEARRHLERAERKLDALDYLAGDLEEMPVPERLRCLIYLLARQLVDRPADLDVQLVSGQAHTLEITCHPDDAPMLVGRGGKIIHAIQAIAETAASARGVRLKVDLLM